MWCHAFSAFFVNTVSSTTVSVWAHVGAVHTICRKQPVPEKKGLWDLVEKTEKTKRESRKQGGCWGVSPSWKHFSEVHAYRSVGLSYLCAHCVLFWVLMWFGLASAQATCAWWRQSPVLPNVNAAPVTSVLCSCLPPHSSHRPLLTQVGVCA